MTTPLETLLHNRLAIALMSALLLGSPLHARFIEHKEHHLGPTGLFGVTSPKDIKVTKVQEGSPADGKIKAGDVIVAAGGTTFQDRTRQQLAAAIDAAETEAGKGILTLGLKDGRSVDLQLKVLGSFSNTAPFDCRKTDAIITQAANHLAASKKFGRGDMNIGLLGLLATGEAKHIKVVRDTIHGARWASPDLKLSIDKYGRTAWGWGYTNLLLCEYYLLTGDEFVLPAIRQYSVALASGRDAAGLWGHGIASLDLNGGRKHGRLPGYAVMNQSSLPCFISLLLADKCGIKHPEIQEGIAQTHGFYTDFIGRGTLPYGVHNPNSKSYNNNGMSGLAAVAFSLHGNTEGAAFFSRMSAAAHNTMETGHTGHFFNQLWTGLGAHLAGPETSAAFFGKTRWLHTLNRTWDGSFTYDGCGYPNGTFSYRGLSDAGSHLLNLCLGRKALFITGRDADASIWLKGSDVNVVIGLPAMDTRSMSDEELLASFGHPMPKVRVEAVWTLRPREHKLAGEILKMTREGTAIERESAIGYFGYGCPKALMLTARDGLMVILRDPQESINIRAAAAGSLCWLVEDGHAAFEDILKLVMIDKPDDPRGRIDETLGRSLNILCPDPHAAGLVKDKDLFYAAALKLMDHRRANGRTSGTKLIANMPLEDFHRVADKILHIIDDEDRTYHAYHNLGPKTESISILASLNIEGGIEAAFEALESPVGKAGFKIRMLMAVLPKYGPSAKPFLPKIKATTAGKFQKQWDAMVKQIESSEGEREMITLEEARRAGVPKTKVSPTTDVYHGVEVADPYRWLEDWSDPEVREWTDAQNKHARSFLDTRPHLETIRERVTDILSAKTVGYGDVQVRPGHFFCMKSEPPKQQDFIIAFDSLVDLSKARVLVDPEKIDPSGGTTIDWYLASPDGSAVAVSLSRAGTEAGDLHFFDTSTGEQIHELVPRVNTGTAGGSLAWTADGKGVFYTRHPREGEKPKEDLNFYQQAFYHEIGTDPANDRYEIGKGFPRIAEIQFEAHHATGQLLLTVQDGDGGEFGHYLRSPEGTWRQFSRFGDRIVNATFSHAGDQIYLLSRAGAPRGKLLRIDAASLDVSRAETVVPETKDTLVASFYGRAPSILPTENHLYLQYQTGGPSEIHSFSLHGKRFKDPEQLPVSRAGGLTSLNDGDRILFSNSSFLVPGAIYLHDPEEGKTTKTALASNPPVDLAAMGVTVKREFATSKDGTKVPVNILLPLSARLADSAAPPGLVTGYGGYGISLGPRFNALSAVLLEQGVVLAVANLRGGGEYGEEWHKQGNLTNKQNVFDDFAAVLEHLVNQGFVDGSRLAIEGGSNGGLLMGALMTQRPDLPRAVVSHVGIYDMLRVELSPNGSFNIPEFGTVKNAAHFKALHAYSPCHNVKDGVRYPATLFLTGVNDPRVDAMQSRKMTARLQSANGDEESPILLRTSLDSGHGAGTPLKEKIAQEVDVHAFLFDQLGIEARKPAVRR